MAHEEADPLAEAKSFLFFFLGILATLLVLWYMTGDRSPSDLRGIFLKPPPPVGTGDSYGPTIPNPASSTNGR